jgi:GAF domain-containing protein
MIVGWETAVNDPARLTALRRSGLVGTGPEDAFDRLIELAAELVGLPRGCITLVDSERTTAKASVGFPEGSQLYAPIEQSFCRYVVSTRQPLIVNDARSDPRTMGDPAIVAFAAVAWAGYPIEDSDGAVLGTFCLMDSSPHDWTPQDILVLATLARAASSEIALRRSQMNAADAERMAADLLVAAQQQRTLLKSRVSELVQHGEVSEPVGRRLLVLLETGEDAE